MHRVSQKAVFRGLITLLAFMPAPRGYAAEPSPAHAPDHVIIPGFERFFVEAQSDGERGSDAVRGGLLLLGELNCVSCHAAGDSLDGWIDAKPAPLLGELRSRADPRYLLRFISDPHGTKPGTSMPGLLAGLSAADRQAASEALMHYLVSLSETHFTLAGADFSAVERGNELFHSVGCVACHAPRRVHDPKLDRSSVPLGKLEEKYSIAGLAGFLSDPLAVRPAGRMPSLNLSQAEAGDIASFLLQDIKAPANLKVSYYEGNWQNVPDFDSLEPKGVGGTSAFSVGPYGEKSSFGLKLEGFLQIERAGEYTFHLQSDDGSRMHLDGALVVDNDGIHAPQLRSGTVQLAAGLHPIKVTFIQGGGGAELSLAYEGPGIDRQPIPSSVLSSTDRPEPAEKAFQPDAALIAKGRQLFTTVGCAACHQLGGNREPVVSTLRSPPLAELRPTAGCLAADTPARLPDYALNAKHAAAIRAALAAIRQQKTPALTTQARTIHSLTRLNCYACHERDKVGGVPRERDAFFTSNGQDLGDEGRIPPLLTGVGDKLNPEWMAEVLSQSGAARPYMNARMPQFGRSNVGDLAAAFVEIDRQPDTLPPAADPPDDARKAGHTLVGKSGLTCISCHIFNRHQSLGIQTMDLAMLAQRLRPDWFRRYMLNPAEYRPGTRMPQAFINGKSTRRDILEGDAERQINALWTYLADGRKAIPPEGLTRQTMELIVGGEAVMYRNFIEGAGPRAIGVGYPEEVNLAFDANQMRPALIWQGRFIDASRHWNGRGDGFQPPLGEKVVKLVEGAPFALLESRTTSWPSEAGKQAGYQFRGYRLDEIRRPTFMYDFNPPQAGKANASAVHVRDFFAGAEQGLEKRLVRTITVTADQPPNELWFRAAEGGAIAAREDGSYLLNDQVMLRFELAAGDSPLLRDSGGTPELLVPVRFSGGKAVIVEEMHW